MIELWIIWLAVGAILIVADIFFQFVWGYCFAVGCVAALVTVILGGGFIAQIAALSATSVVAFLFLLPVLKKWQKKKDSEEHIKEATGMDALIGRKSQLLQTLQPGAVGRMVIDGDNWQVTVPGETEPLPRGTRLTVTGYNSIILTAKKTKNQIS